MFGNMNRHTAYGAASLEAEIMTASQHKMTLMLFDGALKAMRKMAFNIREQDTEEKGKAVKKALDIIGNGLRASLDLAAGGEVAERLDIVYQYIEQKLLESHLKNNADEVDQLIDMLKGIRDAWEEIDPDRSESNT